MAQFEILFHTVIFGWVSLMSMLSFSMRNKLLDMVNNPEALFMHKTTERFYTNWGYAVLTFHYICLALSHFLSLSSSTKKISKNLRIFADYMFTTIVVPIGLVVTSTFWMFYFYNRELIFPSFLDEVFPPWMNHQLHTFNSMLPLLDLLITRHRFPTWSLTNKILWVYLLAYLVCIVDTRLRYGKYLYIVMRYFTTMQVGYYCLLNVVLAYTFHTAIRFICHLRWGPSLFETDSKKVKQK